MSLQTGEPMAIGARLSLEVQTLGEPGPWTALARVVWARDAANGDGQPPVVGVDFIDVDDAGRAAIGRALARGAAAAPPRERTVLGVGLAAAAPAMAAAPIVAVVPSRERTVLGVAPRTRPLPELSLTGADDLPEWPDPPTVPKSPPPPATEQSVPIELTAPKAPYPLRRLLRPSRLPYLFRRVYPGAVARGVSFSSCSWSLAQAPVGTRTVRRSARGLVPTSARLWPRSRRSGAPEGFQLRGGAERARSETQPTRQLPKCIMWQRA
jgi:hypothetical protein